MPTIHSDDPDGRPVGTYICGGFPVYGVPCVDCKPITAERFRNLVDNRFYMDVDDAAQDRYATLKEAGLATDADRVLRHGEAAS